MPGTSLPDPTLPDPIRPGGTLADVTVPDPGLAGHGPSDPASSLARRIEEGSVRIAIIGLGYVGLPLALAFVATGSSVLGFDTDPAKVEALLQGRSYIRHIPAGTTAAALATGRFEPTADPSRLASADAILICVPTPLSAHREPDLRFVTGTAETIASVLRPGQLVVLESTTWPGTTAEVVRPILEAGGLQAGRDFFLGYSPEREDPGSPGRSAAAIPKVIGADDPVSLQLARALYARIVPETVPVGSAATAEAVKLTENIFRAVNIALVNELKVVFTGMGLDVWEVLRAASTKPFGFMPFWPGPGLGGHCIPIDPFYLAWKARSLDEPTRFIELAGEINTAMPLWVVQRLSDALNQRQAKALNGARILLVGIAYKRNVDDVRESPGLRILELLQARGAVVTYHDPYVPEIPPTRSHPGLTGRASVSLDPASIAAADAVLVVTDHDGIDYPALVRHGRLVLDTRDACRRAGADAPHVIQA